MLTNLRLCFLFYSPHSGLLSSTVQPLVSQPGVCLQACLPVWGMPLPARPPCLSPYPPANLSHTQEFRSLSLLRSITVTDDVSHPHHNTTIEELNSPQSSQREPIPHLWLSLWHHRWFGAHIYNFKLIIVFLVLNTDGKYSCCTL